MRRPPGEIAFAEPDRPGARAVEARDHVEHGRLAGPVRADHAGDRAGPGGEVDAFRRRDAAEADADPIEDEGLARRRAGQRRLSALLGDPIVAAPGQQAGEAADQPRGHQPEHCQGRDPEEQQAVLREAGQRLRQQHGDEGPEERAEHRAGSADDHREDEQDRLRERERARRNEQHQRRQDGPREAGEGGGDREGQGLHPDRVEAQSRRGDVGVAHGAHRPAEAAAGEEVEPGEARAGREHRQHGEPGRTHRLAEERRRVGDDEAVLAAGQLPALDQPVLDDEAEGDRQHGEVGALHPHRRHRHKAADERRDQGRRRERQPEADAVERQDRAGVGADRVEAGLAEGDQPGQAEEHVEADPRHRGQRHQGDHEVAVAGSQRDEAERGGGEAGNAEPHRRGRAQTVHRVRPC